MRTAIYPGTFDPVTNGHMDILREASRLFDHIIGAVGVNPAKVPLFPLEERVQMLHQAVQDESLENVEVVAFRGLTVDCAKEYDAKYIVRGLRAVTDFEHELSLVLANEQLENDIKTVFIMPSVRHLYLSSSVVRQAGELGKRVISGSVPRNVEELLVKRFSKE